MNIVEAKLGHADAGELSVHNLQEECSTSGLVTRIKNV